MVRVRTPNGYWMHEPPYTKAEEHDLYQRMAAVPNPYGDGTSSDQIVKIVEQCLAN